MKPGSGSTRRGYLQPPVDQSAALWSAVDRLVERSDSFDDLRAHGLHLLAARRWRDLGREVPESVLDLERRAGMVVLAATIALERARSAYDGTMLVMKGMEVAERYPDTAARPLRDVDLLVERPEEAQKALIEAGFEPAGKDDEYYASRHHLRPLHLPGLPILVELHRHPQWVRWAPAPSFAELASGAIPSSTGVEGLLAPALADHALLIASHSWSGAPLRRILDLVDVTLLAQTVDQAELWETAQRWQVDGVWRTMSLAADAVLFGGPALPWHVRLWAGDLVHVKERSVLSNHVRRIASAFSALPLRRAIPAAAKAIGRELRPEHDDTWPEKLRRVGRALRNPLRPISRQSPSRHDGR